MTQTVVSRLIDVNNTYNVRRSEYNVKPEGPWFSAHHHEYENEHNGMLITQFNTPNTAIVLHYSPAVVV